jgi:hypothetical protein
MALQFAEHTIPLNIVEACMISEALLSRVNSHQQCASEHYDKARTVGDSHWVEADRHKDLMRDCIKLMEKVATIIAPNPVE